MFCPNCAAKNLEGASFCRVCGANISLVPGALSGQLPQAKQEDVVEDGLCGTRRRRGEPSIDAAVKSFFMGAAFLFVSLALFFTKVGFGWWFWLLIPAFMMMGSGVAQYLRLKERQKQAFLPGALRQAPVMPQHVEAAQHRVDLFPSRNTGELVAPPPSVTENTTRHLGAESPTRHFDGKSN
jgi:zinc-ribbon domain